MCVLFVLSHKGINIGSVCVCERGGAEEKGRIKERKLQEARDNFIVRIFRNLSLRSASLRL